MSEWIPATANELSRMVAENFHGPQLPLSPMGGRTAVQFGGQLSSQEVKLIALTELNKVIDYPVRDMTITVEAGIRVEKLASALHAERQRLPIDIPQAHRATLGGVLACDVSGPARYGYGTLRDYVIGMTAVDGQGRLFSAGGRVVKNVAGYDLCKLMIGSLGTLGTLTQVTLKTRPLARTRAFVWSRFDDLNMLDKAVESLHSSQTRPVILDGFSPKAVWQLQASKQALPSGQHSLCIGYEGTQAEVDWQVQTLQQELERCSVKDLNIITDAVADSLWKSLTDYQAASDDPVSFQATLPPSRTPEFMSIAEESKIAVQAHLGNGIVIGHLSDRCANPADAMRIITPLRAFAEKNQGALMIINADLEWEPELDLFGNLPSRWKQMRIVKQTLDPANLMNPGRLFRQPAS